VPSKANATETTSPVKTKVLAVGKMDGDGKFELLFVRDNDLRRFLSTTVQLREMVIGLSPDDPFGTDGFGDNWDCKPTVRTFARDSEEWPSLPADPDRVDWGSAATRRRQQQAEKEAKQKKRQVAKAHMLKKKAGFEAAAVGASMQQQAEEDAAKKAA